MLTGLDYALTVNRLPILIVAQPEYMPKYAHPGDAGADLRSSEAGTIAPGQRRTFKTGVSLAIPDGYVALVHPRSGLAAKHGITVLNAPGTVDAGYRGEIAVTLLNTDTAAEFKVEIGDRIAQLVIQAVETVDFIAVETLPGSHRGEGGFGSTGKK